MTVLLLALLTAQTPAITVNGKTLDARELRIVAQVAASKGTQPAAGNYWYDTATGALGMMGGPTVMFIPAGLGLGGRLPANASGGGNGMLTGVFINGRELHPVDVQQLGAYMRMPVARGRFWVDAQGNAGVEGGPFAFNIHQLAAANGGGAGNTRTRDDGRGNRTSVGNGCAVVHQRRGSGDSQIDTSTYVGCD